ncbi:MAG: hypothetical protein LBJ57_07610 [Prevotellaceae bacterium]|jgi:hypothetical protein|nr:hypothetical protein [Prevotellaceae bacterium]
MKYTATFLMLLAGGAQAVVSGLTLSEGAAAKVGSFDCTYVFGELPPDLSKLPKSNLLPDQQRHCVRLHQA